MKKRMRTCGKRCHEARGTRCKCICQGFYHSSTGAANRQALQEQTEEEVKKTLEQHGFKNGEAEFVHQQEFSLEVS